MIQWLNPWAWAGLGALVVPIVVHLFSRRPPRIVEFPTLRFLDASALRPTQRSTLSDLALLGVRILLLAAAVMALAQPHWVERAAGVTTGTTSGSAAGKDRLPEQAAATASVIERRSPPNPAYGGAADHIAASGDSLVLFAESGQLRTAMTRAVAWLHTQAAPRALVVHSSFPLSALDSTDIVALPSDLRLTLIHEVPSPSAGPAAIDLQAPRDTVHWITALDAPQARDVVAAVHGLGGAVVIRLQDTTAFAEGSAAMRHPLFVGVTHSRARRSRSTATTTATTTATSTASIAIATGAATRATMRLLAVADDRTVRDVTAGLPTDTATNGMLADSSGVALHFGLAGRTAMVGEVHDGIPVVIARVAESPMLATATLLALSDNPAIRSMRTRAGIDRDFRSATAVQQWQPLPAGTPIGVGARADRHTTPTWARWAWALVLVLAVVEWVMRRRP